jgi:hypothetical protein
MKTHPLSYLATNPTKRHGATMYGIEYWKKRSD